ncbi:MAG: arylsulfatase [Arenicellaceae bacterium]|nr:arylsulfatase [Arenicellaceae bacterium]
MYKIYSYMLLICTSVIVLTACDTGSQTETQQVGTQVTTTATAPEGVGDLERSRPNILLIVADDLGYTDLGVYGSEIDTPNLDQLANNGLILTDFHNQAVCAPTRAAILSGTDNHNAGGAMHQSPNQRDVAGYESYLNEDVVAFPALLKQSGYNTYWAGKWHLGDEPHQIPHARGFDRSFALMDGTASHYSDAKRGNFDSSVEYFEDENLVEELPVDFYSTDFYTDYIIDSIDKDSASREPWFAFLGYTAPHWPLQAPDAEIAKYKGYYDNGYEELRENRITKGKELGVIPLEAEMYPRLGVVAAWDSLSDEEKAISSKEMEVYAAMVDVIDQNIGRLIDHLKAIGQYDNTFIVFISDNGAEGLERAGQGWDNSLENMGRISSYVSYGPEWAAAGVGVMRYFKSLSSEGGTRGPAFIHSPEVSKKGQISDAFVSVVDLAPTFLELAGVEHPEFGFNGRPLQPLQGESLLPLAFGDADAVRSDEFIFGWEVFGHLAIRKGDWKLLRLTSKPSEARQPLAERADKWELFDMRVDPGETNDLSAEFPAKVAELQSAWQKYSSTNGLIVPIMD